MDGTVVAIVASDLMFQARLADGVRAAGGTPLLADDALSLEDAVAAAPAAAIIDVHERAFDALTATRSFTAVGVPVLAFGRHTEPELLREAREAGAVRVVARSDIADRLEALLDELLAGRSARG
jgi:DNA-binding NarL/FixJ family response regulator